MRWFLSKDLIVNNSDDITLKEVRLGNTPLAGKSITRNDSPVVGYTVPFGAYFVGFAVDVDSEIPETSDLNNYQFTNAQVVVINSQPIVANGTGSDDDISLTMSTDVNGRPQAVLDVNGATSRYNPFRVSSVRLSGNAGSDRIFVDSSITLACTVQGGDGDDRIQGGGGDDFLSGGAGRDIIRAGDGRDRLNGNGGNDLLFGEAGGDRLYGYNGNDSLDGGSSNDRLEGGAGADTMLGGGGSDKFYARDATFDLLFGGTGIDYAQRDGVDFLVSVERAIA
jgi:Ca2+-binding RTX toxin-like protein